MLRIYEASGGICLPIGNPDKAAAIKKILEEQDHPSDYLLFVIGINSLLHVSDPVALSVGDVLEGVPMLPGTWRNSTENL